MTKKAGQGYLQAGMRDPGHWSVSVEQCPCAVSWGLVANRVGKSHADNAPRAATVALREVRLLVEQAASQGGVLA